ncbi:MAG TPA: M67 family metallopeptidase [Candidatus Angelobacter sp.]|nr:M67 family metallopeptidase [Candidatus Angelobacter sp.]
MLKISSADYAKIRFEGEKSYPNEGCGILIGASNGGNRQVTLVVACDNVAASPLNRYDIPAKQIVDASKLARARNESIVGCYHSHPDHPAQPSATDLEQAFWFDCSYVITRVAGGNAEETRSFALLGSMETKALEGEEIEIL